MRSAFVYLYPIPEYVDDTLERAGRLMSREVTATIFKRLGFTNETYRQAIARGSEKDVLMEKLNKAYIDQVVRQRMYARLERAIYERYRTKGYDVMWTMFQNHSFSRFIPIQPHDTIVTMDIDYATLTTPVCKYPLEYRYPNLKTTLLPALSNHDNIVIGGFHLTDCVYKAADALFLDGKNVKVDEELSDSTGFITNHCDFRPQGYTASTMPSYMTKIYERSFLPQFRPTKPTTLTIEDLYREYGLSKS